MAECNYCTYKRIRERKPVGSRIVRKPDDFGLGGVGIWYKMPDGKLSKQAWFMAIPPRCECD